MAVSVNATATAAVFSTAATPVAFTNLTIAAGSNIVLLVAVVADLGAIATNLAVTWNGVAMTLLLSTTSGAGISNVAIFGLRNPATGNQTASVSWTGGGSPPMYIDAMAFNGANQASDTAAFPTAGRVSNSAASTSLTLTIPSATGNYCLQVNGLNNSQHRTTNSDTELHYITPGSGNFEAQYGAGATSKVMTATLDASTTWMSGGVDIAASVAFLAKGNVANRQAVKRASYW